MLNAFLSFEAAKERHIARTSHPDRYDPDTWMREHADLSRPGQREIQGELLYDLSDQHCVLPEMADLAPQTPASHPRGLGRERSFLRSGGCRSL